MHHPFLQRALRNLGAWFAGLVLAAGLCAPAAAVNKCTSDSGAVTFQEAACPNSAKAKEAVKVWGQDPMLSDRPRYSTRYDDDTPRVAVESLAYTGSQLQNVHQAAAALDNLADMSRDCKIALKVYGLEDKARRSCQQFNRHMKAWYTNAVEVMSEAAKDKEFAGQNTGVLSRSLVRLERLQEDMQFIIVRLKTEGSSR